MHQQKWVTLRYVICEEEESGYDPKSKLVDALPPSSSINDTKLGSNSYISYSLPFVTGAKTRKVKGSNVCVNKKEHAE